MFVTLSSLLPGQPGQHRYPAPSARPGPRPGRNLDTDPTSMAPSHHYNQSGAGKSNHSALKDAHCINREGRADIFDASTLLSSEVILLHIIGAHGPGLRLGAGQWPVAPRAGSAPGQATLSLSLSGWCWHYEHNMQIARREHTQHTGHTGDAYLGQWSTL